MSDQFYRTKDGDTLDYIAWKQYGNQNPGTVETLFLANPDLSAYDDTLPAGLVVRLPEIPVAETQETVKLWD